MVEGEANEVSEEDMMEALMFGGYYVARAYRDFN